MLLPVIAGFIGMFLILSSGLVDVNIEHRLHLPKELTFEAQIQESKFFNFKLPFVHKRVDIYMRNTIGNVNSIRQIVSTLDQTQKGDIVIFHLAGYGGEVDSVVDIINAIQRTSANVITSVEAPVYSGHAYLSVYGKEIKIAKYSFLMFHSSSVVDMDCTSAQGLDRGQDINVKCEQMKKANLELGSKLMIDAPLLTPEQKTKVLEGYDVYIQPEDIK